jgi:trimeric autotransporter adhesin
LVAGNWLLQPVLTREQVNQERKRHMSKNTTRKGLAFGAGLALIASGFTAAPAQAADSLVTGLSSGTSFNSVAGYDNELTLATVMSPGLASNETTLHYRISNPSGAALEIKVGNTTTAVAQVTTGQTSNTGGVWEYGKTAYSSVDSDTDRGGMQTSLTDFVVVPLGTQDGEADDQNFITVGVVDATAVTDVTVTVTAWLDTAANALNVQDSVEITGNTVTLNFYDKANVTATTTMEAPVTGAAFVKATTVTSPELNGQQLGADFIDVSFTAQGNANAVLAENTSSDAAASPTMGGTTYSGVTKSWTSTAYLAYSKASDAWNGANGTVDSIASLASPQSQIAIASNVATISAVAHGLGASNSGTFKARFVGLNSATIASATAAFETLTIASATSFSIPLTDDNQSAENISAGSVAFWNVGTNATVQAAGVYSARPFIGATALGAVGSSNNTAVTADDTEAEIAVSSSVQGAFNDDASSATAVKVKTGTTSVTATATIYYTDALDFDRVKVAPAGVPVSGTLESPTGTFQINSSGAGVATATRLTDANGQVTFTVTTTTAASASNAVTLDIRPQSVALGNASGAKFSLDWDAPVFTLEDDNSVGDQPGSNASSFRHINAGGIYTYGFSLLDQWGNAAAADTWRLQVVNSGRTVSSDTHTLSNGRVSVSVADAAQGSGSTITSTVNVQKLVAGTWTTQATESWDGTDFGTVVINVAAVSTETITFDADGGTTYASTLNNLTADLSTPVSAVATAEANRRTTFVAQSVTNDAVINGRVSNALTGVAKGGTSVTLSGPSNILFSYGDIDKFGSITVPTDASGDFGVKLFSNTAQLNTVITATTANGASKTIKVTFEAAGALTGKNLTITSTGAEPGMTAIITGLLTDKWGNPVKTDQIATNAAGASTLDSGDARLSVSYTGPGLLSGTLPVETGADGTFTVRVLLGSKDSGTLTVSATYGAANGTIGAADTGANIDIKATTSVAIGATAAPATTGKVNVGSFNGKLVVYALGLDGAKISWKVAGKWGVANAVGNTLNRFDRPVGASGRNVIVEIYVNGVRQLQKTVLTR